MMAEMRRALRSTLILNETVTAKLEELRKLYPLLEEIDQKGTEALAHLVPDPAQLAKVKEVFASFPDLAPTNDGPVDTSSTCQEVVDYYCGYLKQHRSPASYVDAVNRLPHWLKYVGKDTKLGRLKHEQFSGYRNILWAAMDKRNQCPEEGMSPAYANRHIRLVKAALNRYQADKGTVPIHVLTALSALQTKGGKNTTDIPILTVDEWKAIKEHADSRMYAICLTALNFAASNTDIDRLLWDMIDFETRVLSFRRHKNDRPRRTLLWNGTIDALKKYRKEWKITGEHVFYTEAGTRLIQYRETNSNDYLSQQFRRLMKSLKLPHRFRVWRKTASTVAQISGCSRETIQMLLGDAPEEIWRRYVMPVPPGVQQAVDAVGKYFGIE